MLVVELRRRGFCRSCRRCLGGWVVFRRRLGWVVVVLRGWWRRRPGWRRALLGQVRVLLVRVQRRLGLERALRRERVRAQLPLSLEPVQGLASRLPGPERAHRPLQPLGRVQERALGLVHRHHQRHQLLLGPLWRMRVLEPGLLRVLGRGLQRERVREPGRRLQRLWRQQRVLELERRRLSSSGVVRVSKRWRFCAGAIGNGRTLGPCNNHVATGTVGAGIGPLFAVSVGDCEVVSAAASD